MQLKRFHTLETKRPADGEEAWVCLTRGDKPLVLRYSVTLGFRAQYANDFVNESANIWLADSQPGEVLWLGLNEHPYEQ